MPLTFQTLGAIDLRDADGHTVSAVVRQPKRLALLAYLAFARPSGFRRRDELVALFWPDQNEERARAALRKTIHALRAALGAEAIPGRGDDELAVNAALLHSDVRAFEAALADARPHDAVALFRGDFLHGFHADASPAFERWLDAERLRLRVRAAEAATALSEAEQAGGDPLETVRWARRALELTPYAEPALRRLLVLLDAAGDRAGALDVYQEFADRLGREFDVDPAPETATLVAAIRARSESHLTVTEAPPTEGDVVVLPGLARPGVAPVPRRFASWRWILPLAAIPLVAVIAGAVLLRPGRAAALDPNRLAIAPFQTFDSTLALWGTGVAEFVSRSLDQAGGLRMVPPSVAARAWEGGVDAGSATAFGRATGAGIVLLGSVLGQGGDSVRISATLVDAQARAPLGDLEIAGTRERVDIVVDSLAVGIVRTLGAAGRVVPMPHSRLSARSLPALKAFLAGETALRRAAWDSALAAFEEAIRLDSAFALAWIRLGHTRLYADVEGGSGWGYIRRAAEWNRGLARHDSLLVEAAAGMAAIMSGAVPADSQRAAAGRIYGMALTLARDYPDDPEAWYAVGAVRDFLFNLLDDVTWEEVADAYTRAIVLDSAFVPAYAPALRYVMGLGDTATGHRLARQLLALNPPDVSRGLPLLIDRMLDRGVSVADRERLLDSLPPEALFRGWIRLWLLPDSAERAITVARAIARRPPDPRYWYTSERMARRDLAAVLAYRGRVREARTLAGTDDDGWFSNLLPDLAMVDAVPAAVVDSALREWVDRHPLREGGLRWSTWWWVRRGDAAALDALLRARGGAPPDVGAAQALARHDTATALRLLAAWRPAVNDNPYGMIVRARLLVAAGRDREALAALERPFFNDWPLTARVLWRLERAQLAERLGERERAREDYAFVAAVWRHADPELQRFVDAARAGARRLGR